MAENGAVSWNFEEKGIITLPKDGLTDDEIFEKATDAGADDVDMEGENYEITTGSSDLHAVVSALEGMGIAATEAKLTMLPKTTVEVDGKAVLSVLKLMEALEDNDDVQDVYTNVEINDEAMEAAMAE